MTLIYILVGLSIVEIVLSVIAGINGQRLFFGKLLLSITMLIILVFVIQSPNEADNLRDLIKIDERLQFYLAFASFNVIMCVLIASFINEDVRRSANSPTVKKDAKSNFGKIDMRPVNKPLLIIGIITSIIWGYYEFAIIGVKHMPFTILWIACFSVFLYMTYTLSSTYNLE